jgi:uncharacterized protein YggU (UPF0235/DUF167 family)
MVRGSHWSSDVFWRIAENAITVAVKVKPHARRPGLRGTVPDTDGDRLAIAVREPPEDGRANRAVCAALAEALGVPPSSVEMAAGASARGQTRRVLGDPSAIAARLATL